MSNNQINTNEYLFNCDSKDVISFDNQKWSSVSNLRAIIYDAVFNSGISSIIQRLAERSDFKDTNHTRTWFHNGQECEILRAGSDGWQKGKLKIKVTLEFIPDEPKLEKSPLDDIRQDKINVE